jgi:hypothetical protein
MHKVTADLTRGSPQSPEHLPKALEKVGDTTPPPTSFPEKVPPPYAAGTEKELGFLDSRTTVKHSGQ